MVKLAEECKFLLELDDILGHRPASVPAVLLDTGTTSQNTACPTQNSAAEGEANGKSLVKS